MWRMMFKMLSARKARFGWLVAELVIVTMAVWALLDPIIVQNAVERQDKGFEVRHLYRIELRQQPWNSPRFVKRSEEQWRDDRWRLLRMVRDYAGVASASFESSIAPFSQSSASAYVNCDTLGSTVYDIAFVPLSDFFTTFRFSESGRLGRADLDRMAFEDGGVVMSEGTFPGRTTMGLVDTLSGTKVVATTGMVRIRPGIPAVPVRICPQPNMQAEAIVFRADDNMDGKAFREAFADWAGKQLKAGNYYAGAVQTYSEYIDDGNTEVATFLQSRTVLGAFFLFCLFLGISGSFWMQTDSRREEIGVMKSFGATSGYIMRMLITEGLILTTVAVLLGCFIYLQYAMKAGLYTPADAFGGNLPGLLAGRYWFEHFTTHFLVVSLATWFVMAVVACTGICIPARNISRIMPTDALHDE